VAATGSVLAIATAPSASATNGAVLAVQPAHPRALWFRGIAAMQSGDAPGAVSRWEALIPLVDEATAAAVRGQVVAARASAGLPPMDPASNVAPAPAANAASTVTVRVEADPALLATLPPSAVLFVFARNADAPGPPVAVKRVDQAQLPLTVTLSDADRVMPTALLSTTARVEVSARFARSGALTTDNEDLIAKPAVAQLGAAEPVMLRLEASAEDSSN
jgi:cytochrome c-type biogenesis protein CcmH